MGVYAARFNLTNVNYTNVYGGGPTLWMGGTAPSFHEDHLYVVTGQCSCRLTLTQSIVNSHGVFLCSLLHRLLGSFRTSHHHHHDAITVMLCEWEALHPRSTMTTYAW